jgi:hypothetical protein
VRYYLERRYAEFNEKDSGGALNILKETAAISKKKVSDVPVGVASITT